MLQPNSLRGAAKSNTNDINKSNATHNENDQEKKLDVNDELFEFFLRFSIFCKFKEFSVKIG